MTDSDDRCPLRRPDQGARRGRRAVADNLAGGTQSAVRGNELGEFRSLRADVWRQFRRHKGADGRDGDAHADRARLRLRPDPAAVRHLDPERAQRQPGRPSGPTSGAPTTSAATPSPEPCSVAASRWRSASSPWRCRSWSVCWSASSPDTSACSTAPLMRLTDLFLSLPILPDPAGGRSCSSGTRSRIRLGDNLGIFVLMVIIIGAYELDVDGPYRPR